MTTDKELRCASCHGNMAVTNYEMQDGGVSQWALCANHDCKLYVMSLPYYEAVARWENEVERIGQERNERNAR